MQCKDKQCYGFLCGPGGAFVIGAIFGWFLTWGYFITK